MMFYVFSNILQLQDDYDNNDSWWDIWLMLGFMLLLVLGTLGDACGTTLRAIVYSSYPEYYCGLNEALDSKNNLACSPRVERNWRLQAKLHRWEGFGA